MEFISEEYPWESAMWNWTSPVATKTVAGSITDYVVTYGDSLNVFLITQSFINHGGMPGDFQDTAVKLRDGKKQFTVDTSTKYDSGYAIFVDGFDYEGPYGWPDREKSYYEAMGIFN